MTVKSHSLKGAYYALKERDYIKKIILFFYLLK